MAKYQNAHRHTGPRATCRVGGSGRGVSCFARRGVGSTMTPRHFVPPLRRGELGLRPVAEPVPLHWRGAPTPGPARRVAWVARPGWLESSRTRTYSPLSSRAKRGDPVNKKVLRAERPQTYCTGLPQSYDNVFNVDRTPSQ